MEKKKKDNAEKQTDGQDYFINGVKVPFPVKAYPTQITMMHKILKGLEKKQNCLLESPTGSGKTLALLCSCLAWQRSEKEKAENEQMLERKRQISQLLADLEETKNHSAATNQTDVKMAAATSNANEDMGREASFPAKPGCAEVKIDLTKDEDIKDDADSCDETDFKSTKKRFRTPNSALPSAKRTKKSKTDTKTNNAEDEIEKELATPDQKPTWRIEMNDDLGSFKGMKYDQGDKAVTEEERMRSEEKAKKILEDFENDDSITKKESARVPRIFFGTRTHKQITQIIRELKKTSFKATRMTILSSREHSCIHPEVSKMRDKNDECQRRVKGLDGKTCKYHGNVSSLCRQHSIEKYKLNEAWDIEDLVKIGNKAKACPYYAARDLMDTADIIFCPYNYLVDPFIRTQMSINLKDEVVVLDEAHNIEDSARDAASITVTSAQLDDVMEELDKLVLFQIMVEEHRMLHDLCSNVCNWLQSMSDVLQKTGYETAAKTLSGVEMSQRLALIQITPKSFPAYKEKLSKIIASENEPDGKVDMDAPKLSSKGLTVLKSLFGGLEKVIDEGGNFTEDFRIVISKKAAKGKRPNQMIGGWRTARNREPMKTWIYSLNFWCMNPAVVFSPIGNNARSIILTSGTLSPMNSFSSELGVAFPIQLEANHVIQDSQVFVGALTVGTDNRNLMANYQNSETFSFQDEVGKVVLQICKTVPRGVLCFFPSYGMLEKLKRRWTTTDIWEQIENSKMVFSEPRGSDRSELDDVMQEFYQAANDKSEHSGSGALLLAVCRGKVSEGLDFTDDNARAVITIGIPFPDFKDTQVELKRKYNNLHSASRGLLTGSEWYEIQAYRALNQVLIHQGYYIPRNFTFGEISILHEIEGASALGRCIRHRRDWGAIILLDERFGRGDKYKKGLSRWVRGRCKTFTEFNNCMSSLHAFSEARRKDPCPEKAGATCRTGPHTPINLDHVTADITPMQKVVKEGEFTMDHEYGIKGEVSTTFVKSDEHATPARTKENITPRNLTSNIYEEIRSSGVAGGASQEWQNSSRKLMQHVGSDGSRTSDHSDRSSIRSTTSCVNANNPTTFERNSNFQFKDVKESPMNASTFFARTVALRNEGRKKTADKRQSFFQNRSKLFKVGQKSSMESKEDSSVMKQRMVNVEKEDEPIPIIDLIDDDDAGGLCDNIKPDCIAKSVLNSKLSRAPNFVETPILFSEESKDFGSFEDKFWDDIDDSETNQALSEKALKTVNQTGEFNAQGKSCDAKFTTTCEPPRHHSENDGTRKSKEELELSSKEDEPKHFENKTQEAFNETKDGKKKSTRNKQRNKKINKNASSENRSRNDELEKQPSCGPNSMATNRRRSTRRTSNLRMTSNMDKNDCSKDISRFDAVGTESNLQKAVFCSCCNTELLENGPVLRIKIDSSFLSKHIGGASWPADVIKASFGSLKNCRMIDSLHKCDCATEIGDLQLNACYSQDDGKVYIPLICDACHLRLSRQKVVGFKVIHVGKCKTEANMEADGKYDVILLPNAITLK